MRIEVDMEIDINVGRLVKKVNNNELGLYAATSWHRLYTPYVPYVTGDLCNTVRLGPWQIHHTVPYAHKMYTGRFNFTRDLHPLASRKWDKAAQSTQKRKLIRELQEFIDRGGLNLGKQ